VARGAVDDDVMAGDVQQLPALADVVSVADLPADAWAPSAYLAAGVWHADSSDGWFDWVIRWTIDAIIRPLRGKIKRAHV